MGEGFLRGDLRHLRARTAAERTAGCRDDESSDLVVRTAAESLRDGGVLGVDRDDLVACSGGEHELPTDDQRLLVRERQRAPRLERGEGRSEPDRAGDRIEHHVGLDIAHELLGLCGSESGVLDLEARRLLGHQCGVRACGETDQLEASWVGPDDVERLRADGAGGAEDDDATHGASLWHRLGPPRA